MSKTKQVDTFTDPKALKKELVFKIKTLAKGVKDMTKEMHAYQKELDKMVGGGGKKKNIVNKGKVKKAGKKHSPPSE